MAEIVVTLALSHAPGMTGWLDRASPEAQENPTEGFHEFGRLLRAAGPDVIVGLANDHVLNIPMESGVDFLAAAAGPAPPNGSPIG